MGIEHIEDFESLPDSDDIHAGELEPGSLRRVEFGCSGIKIVGPPNLSAKIVG